jgi:hypothetical protein
MSSKTLYWIVTGVMAAFMSLASVPDILRNPQAVSIFMHLGYPTYLLLFLGTAKLLGIVAVLVPGFGRLREWAFAGLTFDLLGALYSHLSVGDSPAAWMPAVIGLLLVGASYFLYRGQLSNHDTSHGHTSIDGHGTPAVAHSRAAVVGCR